MLYAIILVLALVVVMVALAARKPDTFRIARETLIQAPPDRIFVKLVLRAFCQPGCCDLNQSGSVGRLPRASIELGVRWKT